jgi:hypothetical protein
MATRPPLLRRTAALAALLTACAAVALASPFAAPDRRVVDLVAAGSALSEAEHGYAGHDDSTGSADGRAYRQARGWMRYAVTTFDDTEVTIACTFLSGTSGSFDLIVEDSVIATKRVDVTTGTPTVVELLVPFAVTKGKTSIAVMLRAHNGPTPRLHELRTIQDHNEVPLPSGVFR